MSQEILVPFGLNSSGGIAVTTDPGTQTQQHVDSLVSTRPGERAMLPAYGVDVASQLFAPNAASVSDLLMADVQQAMATYEPGVNVIGVRPITSQADPASGSIALEVDYTTSGPAGNSRVAATVATVLIGGTVIEQTP